MRRYTFSCLSILLTVTAGCQRFSPPPTGPETPLSGTLLLTGSTTIAPLMQSFAERFRQRHPGVQIVIQPSGSNKGLEDVRKGTCNIGMASRSLKENEKDLLGFALARDGVCLIAHADNPVDKLTSQQVADLFSGKISDWSDVGGESGPVHVLNRTSVQSELELFCRVFNLPRDGIKAKALVGSNTATFEGVAADRQSVSYVSLGEAERKCLKGANFKRIGLDGVAATSANVRTGDFGFSRPLILVTRELPSGAAKAFIEFATSSAVTDLVEQYDFIPYLD